MTLNDIADQVFVINLERRQDRAEHMREQSEKHQFDALVVRAVDAKEIQNPTGLRDGEYALLLSYASIIQWARQKGFDKIIILEDDAFFVDDFEPRLESEWPLIPADWDLVFLGENNSSLGAGWIPSVAVNSKIRKVFSSFGAHAILIRSNMYDSILDGISSFDKPLDVMFASLQQHCNAYGFIPTLCKQRSFHSDIIGFNPEYLEKGVFDK